MEILQQFYSDFGPFNRILTLHFKGFLTHSGDPFLEQFQKCWSSLILFKKILLLQVQFQQDQMH